MKKLNCAMKRCTNRKQKDRRHFLCNRKSINKRVAHCNPLANIQVSLCNGYVTERKNM